jgi:hypothetical protein
METRLLALERKLARAEDAARQVRRGVIGLGQSIWDGWSDVGPSGATCTASYSGNVLTCSGAGLVSQALTITNHATGAVLDTPTTTTGGAFSGSFAITAPSLVIDITGTKTGWGTLSTTATISCGANALGNLAFPVNHAPTINSLSNATFCGDPGAQTVSLSGIGDGDGGTQSLTVTAVSNNTGRIPNPTVTYTSPNSTGSISYTPVAGLDNTASITVTVTDNGCGGGTSTNATSVSFTVKVVQPKTPTLDPIANFGPVAAGSVNTTVNLSGISAGANEPTGGPFTISVVSSAPGVSDFVSLSYTSPAATGSFTISNVSAGTATFTVTLTDTNAGHCGTNTRVRTFTNTVV